MDHLQILQELRERSNAFSYMLTLVRMYKLPLCMTFVNYKKNDNVVKIPAVLQSLNKHKSELSYVELVEEMYNKSQLKLELTSFHTRLMYKKEPDREIITKFIQHIIVDCNEERDVW